MPQTPEIPATPEELRLRTPTHQYWGTFDWSNTSQTANYSDPLDAGAWYVSAPPPSTPAPAPFSREEVDRVIEQLNRAAEASILRDTFDEPVVPSYRSPRKPLSFLKAAENRVNGVVETPERREPEAHEYTYDAEAWRRTFRNTARTFRSVFAVSSPDDEVPF